MSRTYNSSTQNRIFGWCRRAGIAGVALAVLAGCAPGEYAIGSRTISWPGPSLPQADVPDAMANQIVPIGLPGTPVQTSGQSFGRGPVRIALILPLSGDAGLSSVGTSMANGARLAMNYIETSGSISDNITVVLKDSGGSAGGAAQATRAAVAEGASLILGPLKADQVRAAGSVARAAGVPVIGFSNDASAAGPGVYLLSVLPENEVKRSLTLAQAQGRKGFAAIFPNTAFGRVQERAFVQASRSLGVTPAAIYHFSNENEARSVTAQLLPQIAGGQVDAVFLPDRGTAPSFGAMIEQGGINRSAIAIIGSADWEGDNAIRNASYLTGAIYPAVDPAGYNAIASDYQRQFGSTPHPLTTIAYTATILANASALSMATPRYDAATMTAPAGFRGRDGIFRFKPNGQADYALVVKQVVPGGSSVVDGPRL
ncbi:penicillin-binding protein activator [Devosia rhodophyticola]|uniref:Penicillin-binding protein activator n=1 Tax=Devosia rhodophyticola TaxID=3026423 RepID=A0ABY7Z1B3_9HYPH|nr:penicillin-binding protein activator [Devosia rhodophyticola]WDR07342.1 penicillin-binding protein activator [Devosia rhodophyticola]